MWDEGLWDVDTLESGQAPVSSGPGVGPGGSTWRLEPHGHRSSRQQAEPQWGQLTARSDLLGFGSSSVYFPNPRRFPALLSLSGGVSAGAARKHSHPWRVLRRRYK